MDDDLKAVVAELERLAKAALEPVLVGAEKAAHMRQREYRFAANPSTVLRLISALRQRDEALRLAESELVACSEYLDPLIDADGDSEGFHPNREMTLKAGVDRAIEQIDGALK